MRTARLVESAFRICRRRLNSLYTAKTTSIWQCQNRQHLTSFECLIFVYSSKLGDIRLWAGPRLEHFLSTRDLTISVADRRQRGRPGTHQSHDRQLTVQRTRHIKEIQGQILVVSFGRKIFLKTTCCVFARQRNHVIDNLSNGRLSAINPGP